MGLALVVSPRQAGELYNVAADQTGIAEPDALIRVHPQARVVVVVQRASECDLAPPPHSRPGQLLSQILDRHGLFCGIYRPRVGDAPISGGASLGVFGYHVVTSSFERLGVDDLAGL